MTNLINPVDQYPADEVHEQQQTAPGLDHQMSPQPDHGEDSYRGSGKLTDRKALITGADSGIGRAVAIAFAVKAPTWVWSTTPPPRPPST